MVAQSRKPTKPLTPKQEDIIATVNHHPSLSTREVATLCKTDHSYVVQVMQRYNIQHNKIQDYKSNRVDILAGVQHRLISSITDEDIKKAPLGSRILAACQLYDKERLESGLSTGNLAVIHADIAALRNVDIPVDNSTCQPNNDHVDV
jgi:hypothetical protein